MRQWFGKLTMNSAIAELRNIMKSYFKFILSFLALIIIGIAGYGGWYRYGWLLSKEGRQRQVMANQYLDWQKQADEAYKNDTYGGKTPEETLNLFVEALKKEDIELASKYFALDDNLSREKWEKALREAKLNSKLGNLISLLERARPGDNSDEYFKQSYFTFVVYDKGGAVEADITLTRSPVSGVWKIESL